MLLIGGVIAILLVVGLLAFVAPRWPFRESDMKKRIESATGSTAHFGGYHQVFFPSPGCVIREVTLTPKDPAHPQVTMQKLTIQGLYSGLIGREKHLSSLSFEGLQILVPAREPSAGPNQPLASAADDLRFDEIDAKDSRIVFAADESHPEDRSYNISKLVLTGFAPRQAIHFKSVLRIPTPPADVEISGTFGPLSNGELGDTPLAGSFSLQHADLAKFHALTGTLSGRGRFDGNLSALHVNGETDAPNFGLTDTHHSIRLNTQFSALVNGTNGDVTFEPVHAVMGETKLVAQGQLVSVPGEQGKKLALDITSDDARIQDLMLLFVHNKPPLQGATRFQAKVLLPTNDSRPFEERVQMKAHFGIRSSRFTTPETEQKVSELSESARGNPKEDDPPMVVTDLSGDVVLANGSAKFSRLALRVPGASADLHGTYKLESHAVDLRGMLQTDVKLSKATSGFKAFLMKVVEAAKAKKKEGATVPVKVTGTYEKPEFGLDATAEK